MKTNYLMSAAKPARTINVREELTVFPSCCTRTELLAVCVNNMRREGCSKRGKQ